MSFENPFQDNPYSSPNEGQKAEDPARIKGKLLWPGVALTVVASLGMLVTIFNAVFALTASAEIDPTAPKIIQEMQRNSVGVATAAVQSAFVVVNFVILAGAIQMMRARNWGLAIAASIVSMLNFGSGCCLLGLPIGVWSLVILCQEDVKEAFQMRAKQS